MATSNLQPLGYTKNHVVVYYDPRHSHVATHFKDAPQLPRLVKKVLGDTVTTGEYMWFEADMGRMVGVTDLIETDNIVYAKRTNRNTYTRFTKSRTPQPSSIVTLAMEPMS